MIIYKATNRLNGKVYIGATTKSLGQRMKLHINPPRTSNKTYFVRSLKKYGAENFKWQVICICPNLKSLYEQERYYIRLYNTMNVGYNDTSGGINNYLLSERIKTQMRKSVIRSIKEKKKYGDDYYSYYFEKYINTYPTTLILE